jgi:hypothetical protein
MLPDIIPNRIFPPLVWTDRSSEQFSATNEASFFQGKILFTLYSKPINLSVTP